MTRDAAVAAALSRRDALQGLLGAAALAAVRCGGARRIAKAPAAARAEGPAREVLGSVVDWVPAAGLRWLVEVRPRQLLATAPVAAAVRAVVPDARFEAFARRHGGVDPRRVEHAAIAGYDEATLTIARVACDAPRVEAAFAARAEAVEGRAADGVVTRLWGRVEGAPEEVAVFGGEAVAVDRGRDVPLRASVSFAEGRMRRSLPALRAEPLRAAAQQAGEAPLRAFAPGPFEGDWAHGVGGLLAATTAVATTLRPLDGGSEERGAVDVAVILTGAWGADAAAAAERLRSAFGVIAQAPIGRLTGLDRPLDGPRPWAAEGAIGLRMRLGAMALARGIHAAGDGTAREIMNY